MSDREIELEYYLLEKIIIYKPKEGEFRLVNASCGFCRLCGKTITGMGGSSGMVCLSCGDELLQGEMKLLENEARDDS